MSTEKRSKAPPPPPAPATIAPAPEVSPQSAIPTAKAFAPSKGTESTAGTRVLIYGTGGIGKTTLAAAMPDPYFIDLERGMRDVPDVYRTNDVASWGDLRSCLAWLLIRCREGEGPGTVVIDSMSAAQDLATEWIVMHRKTEKGKPVSSIEGFGWGKGWTFVYDEIVALLSDLENIAATGTHVCLVAHDVSTVVPNPDGEDFLRWEPLMHGGDKKGRADVRSRIKNWSDFVVYIGYDLYAKDGKARGGGTRTLYVNERPTHIAKRRGPVDDQAFTLDDLPNVWARFGVQ